MQRVVINVLGFEPTKGVPSTVEEYNALAPTRVNPVLEDAIDTTIYRGSSPVIRDNICTMLETDYKVTRRGNDSEGWEKESAFVKRALAELIVSTGKTESQLRAEMMAKVQGFADAAPFPVSVKERSSEGPVIGKRDLALAAQVIKDGKADGVAAKLATILGREVATDEKSLARGIADNRRAIAAAAEQAQKAQLGL